MSIYLCCLYIDWLLPYILPLDSVAVTLLGPPPAIWFAQTRFRHCNALGDMKKDFTRGEESKWVMCLRFCSLSQELVSMSVHSSSRVACDTHHQYKLLAPKDYVFFLKLIMLWRFNWNWLFMKQHDRFWTFLRWENTLLGMVLLGDRVEKCTMRYR